MKQYLILLACCATANVAFLHSNQEIAEKSLKAAIVKMILNNDTSFDDSTVAKAKKHPQDPRSLKELFMVLREQKKNPEVAQALAKNAILQKAVCTVESIIGESEVQRRALEKQMDQFDDSMIEVFISAQVISKKFNAEEISSLEQVLETKDAAPEA